MAPLNKESISDDYCHTVVAHKPLSTSIGKRMPYTENSPISHNDILATIHTYEHRFTVTSVAFTPIGLRERWPSYYDNEYTLRQEVNHSRIFDNVNIQYLQTSI